MAGVGVTVVFKAAVVTEVMTVAAVVVAVLVAKVVSVVVKSIYIVCIIHADFTRSFMFSVLVSGCILYNRTRAFFQSWKRVIYLSIDEKNLRIF